MGMTNSRSVPRDVGCAGVADGCLREGVFEAIDRPPIAPGEQMPIDGQGKGRGSDGRAAVDCT
jgi:hypothetical protein